MAVAECGIRQNLAEYYGQKSAPGRLQGVGGEAGQTPIFFTQAWDGGLNDAYQPFRHGRVMQQTGQSK